MGAHAALGPAATGPSDDDMERLREASDNGQPMPCRRRPMGEDRTRPTSARVCHHPEDAPGSIIQFVPEVSRDVCTSADADLVPSLSAALACWCLVSARSRSWRTSTSALLSSLAHASRSTGRTRPPQRERSPLWRPIHLPRCVQGTGCAPLGNDCGCSSRVQSYQSAADVARSVSGEWGRRRAGTENGDGRTGDGDGAGQNARPRQLQRSLA